MWNLIQSFSIGALKVIGSLVLGGTILGLVAQYCGPREGVAYIHVSTPAADVTVDEAQYHVETLWETPIVCDLRPGRHTVRMLRSGRIIYEEDFTIAAGQELILTAWDGYHDGRSPSRPGEGRAIEPSPQSGFGAAGLSMRDHSN